MKAVAVVFGFMAALVVGAIALFTAGEVPAIIAVVLILGIAIYAAAVASRGVLATVAVVMVILFLAGVTFTGWQAFTIIQALTDTEGPADPADPAALAAANAKFDDLDEDAGFRLELFEDEIEAVVQDGLSDEDVPLRRVEVDLVAGTEGEQGRLAFLGEFKSGDLEVEGSVSASLDAGSVQIELIEADLGALSLPGAAEGAVEDLIESIADLNDLLADNRADVQSISIDDERVLITGTQGGGELLTSEALLSGLRDQVAAIGSAAEPPPERLGPGSVDALTAEGPSYYVALGDSLAANVGVERPRDGYVSRLHRALEERDGASYGLRNFGISGETTGTLIRNGQLDDATAFMRDNDVAYVTIDIGANDLLGHLGSGDCSESLESAACEQRLAATFATYVDNMTRILNELVDAAPDATIVFMRAYNPFSLGFGAAIGAEETSTQALDDFNDIAAGLAADRGIIVADGFTPMLNTTGATTHMLDNPPDIHPLPIGYDILAFSIIEALGG